MLEKRSRGKKTALVNLNKSEVPKHLKNYLNDDFTIKCTIAWESYLKWHSDNVDEEVWRNIK